MARVHYYVHGRGRGHATRSKAVVTALREAGHDVDVHAGRDAVAMFRDEGGSLREVTSLLPTTPPAEFVGQLITRSLQGAIDLVGSGADIVVSDGDLPSVLAATMTGRPSLAIGHGLVFTACRMPVGVSAGPWRREARKARLSSLTATHRLAVNFVPLGIEGPGATLCRPMVDEDLRRRVTDGVEHGPVLCYFRDDNGDELVRALVRAGVPVVLFTGRTGVALGGATVEPLGRERFVDTLVAARAVVASAGSQLMSECVALGVPQFAIFDARDDEQRLNVEMLRGAGLGDGGPIDEVVANDVAAWAKTVERRPPPASWWGEPDVATVAVELVARLLG